MSNHLDADRQIEFMELVAPNQSRLFGYIYALVGNSSDAHDVYQQTVLVLWKKFHTYKMGTNFCAWAFRTAKFECLAFRRKNHKEKFFLDAGLVDQISDEQVVRAENAKKNRDEALAICIEKLTPKDAKLLSDCYRHDTSLGQVATKLGRSAQSLSNSLRRVRLMLHRCIIHELGDSA